MAKNKQSKSQQSNKVTQRITKLPESKGKAAISKGNRVTWKKKPIASLQAGSPYVPKSGMYKLDQGEMVVPANQNPLTQQWPGGINPIRWQARTGIPPLPPPGVSS